LRAEASVFSATADCSLRRGHAPGRV
jgi:hypothetical protein